jgi:hypothetical protein
LFSCSALAFCGSIRDPIPCVHRWQKH